MFPSTVSYSSVSAMVRPDTTAVALPLVIVWNVNADVDVGWGIERSVLGSIGANFMEFVELGEELIDKCAGKMW